jgi:MoaA/NifB/PqqE/SkfB family radical SAM enzyme
MENNSMDGLAIELTNACNRRCLHCFRNKADAVEFLPLTLAREVLSQARRLGFQTILLTGGEVALYPYLEEFLALVVEQGLTFSLVTNGHRFRDNLLPLLSAPKFREKLHIVCFSLDGAKSETHDALRGRGSFREVVEAATLCQLKEIPFSFKTVVTNFNKEELIELALLVTTLGAQDQSFLHPYPAPLFLREEIIPSPEETRDVMEWIAGSLAKAMRIKIRIEGFDPEAILFKCQNILELISIDFQGNLILCCNLSHVTREEGQLSVKGRECLGNLKEISLRDGLIRHYHAVAQLMEARVRDADNLTDLTINPCYWCFKHFGKLEWLKDYPESPWSTGVLEKETCHAAV